MAQKVQVILIDDVDGGKADETVSFALDGVTYEIDLSSRHAAELRGALGPWLTHARRVNAKSGRGGRASGRSSGGDVAKVRAWAKSHGYSVSERGRIAADVREAYEAATA